MDALFPLLACFLAGMGARDQMLLASLTRSQGWRWDLVVAVLVTSIGTCVVAGMVAREMTEGFIYPIRLMIAALALGLAGGESLLKKARSTPEEPTYAIFPAIVVVLADQITDSSRFLILAFTVAMQTPLPAVVGGALGSGVALLLGALYAQEYIEQQGRFIMVRRLAGMVLLLAAVGLGLWARVVAQS